MDLNQINVDNIKFDFITEKLIKLKTPIIIKLKNVIIPFGIETYKDKLYLTLEVNKIDSYTLKTLENSIKNRYLEFLKELKNTIEIDLNFEDTILLNSFIKKEKEKSSLIKLKIKTYKKNPILKISNNISCFELTKNSKCSTIIVIEGIWKYNNSFGLLSYVKELQIYSSE